MTTNKEDYFDNRSSRRADEESDAQTSPRRRQRIRLTREEMQAIGERRRNFDRENTDSDSGLEDRRTGYTPRPRPSYDDRRSDKNAGPSYRERYKAEHSDDRYAPRRNEGSYRNDRNDRNGTSGYKPRRNYGDQNNRTGGYKREGQNSYNYGKNNAQGKYNAGGKKPYDKNDKGQQKPFNKKPNQKPVKQRPHYEFEKELQTEQKPVRLNKFLAHAGIASRREADELILAGAVVVNGTTVLELGTKVMPGDRVEVNGKPLTAEQKVYILLNKPRNVVTTTEDPQERMTVLNLIKNAGDERIYPVGRLDRNTTGVLLLTNDGDLAAKLVHPSFKKKKIYQVWLDKEVVPEDMQKLADGIELTDGEMHADAISYVDDEDHTQVGIEIHSGKNRIVRRLFEALGYRVVKLDRVYFAGLTKKNLGRGKWRYLTEEEVVNLKNGFFD